MNSNSPAIFQNKDSNGVYNPHEDDNIVFQHRTLHECFEEQALIRPESICLLSPSENISWTYSQLNGIASQISQYIRNILGHHLGKQDSPIGICMPRSATLIASILGTLKSGKAYLPLYFNAPYAELQFQLQNSNAVAIIAPAKFRGPLSCFKGTFIETESIEFLIANPIWEIQHETSENNSLAYVIYTSGSTGQPKGVQVEHASVLNRLSIRHISAQSSDTMLLLSPVTFDNSVFEIFSPLVSGAILVVPPESIQLDIKGITDIIQDHGITILQVVPSMLNELVKSHTALVAFAKLRILITGGEPLTYQLCQETLEILPEKADFFNIYGVTEATIDSTLWKCTPRADRIVPIGKSISAETVQVYILDEDLQPISTTTEGQLYIGGAGLARGYVTSELTDNKFLCGPFTSKEIISNRLYKTGDRARLLPDGNIEFLGRSDDQVKIHGVRVALGQIASAILTQEGVCQVVVLKKEVNDRNCLVAYTQLASTDMDIDFNTHILKIREGLKAKLVPQLIPSIFIHVKEFPLTTSGKIDRLALAERNDVDVQFSLEPYEAPKNDMELALCSIWEEALKIKRCGRKDNLFRLGGDSIVVMRICNKAQECSIPIKPSDVFEAPTIAELVSKMSGTNSPSIDMLSRTSSPTSSKAVINQVDQSDFDEEHLPLSPLQSGLLFNSLYNESGNDYLIRTLIKIKGDLNLQVFQKAWEILGKHCSAFRTRFEWEGPTPEQIIEPSDSRSDAIVNSRNWKVVRKSDLSLDALLGGETQCDPIDLKISPVMSWHILEDEDKNNNSLYILWTVHHIILDGWSISMLLDDVFKIYEKLSNKTFNKMEPYPSMSPFITETVDPSNKALVEPFWSEYLSEMEAQTDLPIMNKMIHYKSPRNHTGYTNHLVLEHNLGIHLSKNLKSLSKQCGVTLHTIFQAAWSYLLSRYLGHKDVLFGVTMSCRGTGLNILQQSDETRMAGLLINTLPFRIIIDEEQKLEEFFNLVQNNSVALGKVSRISQLFKIKELKKRPNGYFDTLFVFENYPESLSGWTKFHNIQAKEIKVWDTTEYPLSLAIVPNSEDTQSVKCVFSYKKALFSPSSIQRMASHYETILASMVSHGKYSELKKLEIMPKAEINNMLNNFGSKDSLTPRHSVKTETFLDLFTFHVKNTPTATAIIDPEGVSMSYEELYKMSNRFSNYLLVSEQLQPEQIVGICGDKSVDFYIVLLGILKAGGAFLTLDPLNPQKRLDLMVENSGTTLVLVQLKYMSRFSLLKKLKMLALEPTLSSIRLNDTDYDDIRSGTNPTKNMLAYILFTSGSTGIPKAVQVEHKGIKNLALESGSDFDLNGTSRILQFASVGFDTFVSEWAMAWGNGAALCLPKPGKNEIIGQNLVNLLAKQSITCVTLPPIVLSTIPKAEVNLPALKTIILAGDVADWNLVQKWISQGKDVYNSYGPTEATVCATIKKFSKDQPNSRNIGRPISNTKIHILDEHSRTVPVQIIGEIYITGIGVARGYLNYESKSFLKNFDTRFSTHYRTYRTGDLGRFLEDGSIEFLGRVEQHKQVKLRGFRIELKEIESIILSKMGNIILDVCVIVREDGGPKKLVAYLCTPQDSISSDLTAKVNKCLEESLPDYMVPKIYVTLHELPRNINGKLDKSALPVPPDILNLQDGEAAQPRNETERSLCLIWKELLAINGIGIHDNFFQLGGDSIQSILMKNRAHQLGIEFTVKQIFENPTISRLAALAKSHHSSSDRVSASLSPNEISTMPSESFSTLTPIQKWFFEQNFAHPAHWNQSILLKPKVKFNEELLRKAITVLIEHHDILRIRFCFPKSKDSSGLTPAQFPTVEYLNTGQLFNTFQAIVLKGLSAEECSEDMLEITKEVQSGFDLEKGPLFKAVLFKSNFKEEMLFFCAHHTVVDNVSWMILVSDLMYVYSTLVDGSQPHKNLLSNTTSYNNWARELEVLATSPGNILSEDLEYWKNEMAVINNSSNPLMTYNPKIETDSIASSCVLKIGTFKSTFSSDFTSLLLHEANKPYRTKTNELLLTALTQTVYEELGLLQALIMVEGHGRYEDVLDNCLNTQVDLSRSVGWFTCLYPVVLQLENPENLAMSIKSVKDKLRFVLNHGLTYGVLKDKVIHHSVPEISFNYTGQLNNTSLNYFEIAEEMDEVGMNDVSPQNHIPHSLALDIEIRNNFLEVTWTFDLNKYSKSLVQNAANSFKRNLEVLVEHCLETSRIYWTPSDFPLVPKHVLKCQHHLDNILNNLPSLLNLQDLYPLTPTQSGILISSLKSLKPLGEDGKNNSRDVYITQTMYKIQGSFHLEEFRKAWQTVINDHDVLRSGLISQEIEEPLQFVVNRGYVNVPWKIMEFSGSDIEEELQRILFFDKNQPFCFDKPPLMRAHVIKVNQLEWYFIWTFHHIILDGWSAAIILKQVHKAYRKLMNQNFKQLKAKNMDNDECWGPVEPFKNFLTHALIQRRRDLKSIETFWATYLQGLECTKFLQLKKPDPVDSRSPKTSEYFKANFAFTPEEFKNLKSIAQSQSVTLNCLMQTAWAILLSFYSSKTDVVFGVVLSGRHLKPQFSQTVGLLIETVPLRVNNISPNELVKTVMVFVQAGLSQIQYQGGHTNLSEILGFCRKSNNDTSQDGDSSLFDTLFVFENYPDESNEFDMTSDGKSKMTFEGVNESTDFPLTVIILPELDGSLKVEFSGVGTDFDQNALNRLAGHFKRICIDFKPDLKVKDVPWISSSELIQLEEWNDTKISRWNLNIHQMFEQQVQLNPNAIAVNLQDEEVTYAKLNHLANQWGHFLSSKRVINDSLVAICMNRSINLIAVLMGILKAGGAYVPLDPCYPKQRIIGMLNDSDPVVLITEREFHATFFEDYNNTRTLIVHIEDILPEIRSLPTENLDLHVPMNNLAYVMYTSGSTGTPKGVAMEHACVTNLFQSTQVTSPITLGDKMLVKISLGFDVSVSEIFWPLSTGAQLVLLPPSEQNDVSAMAKSIEENQVTIIRMVPAVLNAMLLVIGETPKMCKSLRIIICSGEPLSQQTFSKAMTMLPNLGLLSNKYGPTETHEITTWEGSRNDFNKNNLVVSIGRPLHNCKILILNKHLKPVPVGLVGEIYIGGVCLAREYLGKSDMTKERFVSNPFYDNFRACHNDFGNSPRLYKTGDLGRWMEAGNIEYLGRIDHQVKIRGYRIELEEIEKAFLREDMVNESLVCCITLNQDQNDNVLVAYVVPATKPMNDQTHKFIEDLKSSLEKQLPNYMIPTAIILVDEFPFTSNGKIDRKKLPIFDRNKLMLSSGSKGCFEDEDLISDVEKRLGVIWTKVLGLTRVGRKANFFHLGGHSLLAMKVVYLAKKEFGFDVSLRFIFDQPVLSGLAEFIDTGLSSVEKKTRFEIETKPVKECESESNQENFEVTPLKNTSLTPQQRNLWFLSKLLPQNVPVYTIPVLLRISGNLNIPKFKTALYSTISIHKSLNTIFSDVEGEPCPIVLSKPLFDFKYQDLSNVTEESVIQLEIQKFVALPFNLEVGPLFRCFVTQISSSPVIHQVLLTVHHILVDQESIEILLRDIFECYERGEDFQIDLSIKVEPEMQHSLLELEESSLTNQVNYWRTELANFGDRLISLPFDYIRPQVLSYQGRSHTVSIPDDLTLRLVDISRRHQVTMSQLYLAAFQVLLYKYTGGLDEDILIGLPVSFRHSNNHSSSENSIGYFVNTVVTKASFPDNHLMSFAQFLKNSQRNAVEAYSNSDIPFDQLCDEVSALRRPNVHPLFQVMFSFIQESMPLNLNSYNTKNLNIQVLELESQVSKFDLTLAAHLRGNTTRFSFEYSTDLFDHETIVEMSQRFLNLLDFLSSPYDFQEGSSNMNQPINTISLMSPTDFIHIQGSVLQGIPVNFEKFSSVIGMFNDQVMKNPDAIAIGNLTYYEVNLVANQFSKILTENYKIATQAKVVFCMDRSVEFVISVIGTWKSRCVYVPIDPTLPIQRILLTVEDCQPVMLFVDNEESKLDLSQRLPANIKIVNLNQLDLLQNQYRQDIQACLPEPEILEEDTAYIIYTSGSTGIPKGVEITHRNIASWVQSINETIRLNPTKQDCILLATSISFDVSISEIIWPLTSGCRLVISPSQYQTDLYRLTKLIESEGVTVIRGVPTMLSLLTYPDPYLFSLSKSVRIIITAGEALSHQLGSRITRELPNTDVYNLYGATETTIDTTIWKFDPSYPKVIVGKPFQDVNLYVLDKNMQPVPSGIIGEICVSGASLAKGYINRDLETRRKFLKNPFKKISNNSPMGLPHSIIYKTGDLGRILRDGNIECIGRTDSQIKLKGYRIELEEIEAVIQTQIFVKQVVVTLQAESLVAYVILNTCEQPVQELIKTIKKTLVKSLPYYMIPSCIITMDKFPTNSAGKIDRKAFSRVQNSTDVDNVNDNIPSCSPSAPKTDLERRMTSIWENVLNCARGSVGIHDNFFSLGGHSVLAVQLAREIENKLGLTIPVFHIYKYATVASLINVVLDNTASNINCTENQTCTKTLPKFVVPINDEGSQPPLFLIHPGLALACDFLNIWVLDKDQPIYGISNPLYGLGTNSELSSFHEMVMLYLDVITSIQPNGLYRIGGWCLGGSIALEMARILQSQGNVVEIVILIDTFNIPKRFIEERIQEDELIPNKSLETEDLALRSLLNVELKGFNGKVVLLKARDLRLSAEEMVESFDDPDVKAMKNVYNGWEELCPNIQVFSIPGDNDTLLDFPHVIEFGIHFNKTLAQLGNNVDDKLLKFEDSIGNLEFHEKTMFRAIFHEDLYTIRALLEMGVILKLHCKDKLGRTMWDLAKEIGIKSIDMDEYLLDCKAKLCTSFLNL